MADKLSVMRAFQQEYLASSPIEACSKFVSEDFRLIEPPELPQGGIFEGWDAPVRVGEIYRAIWDVEPLQSEFYEVPDSEILVSRYHMKWTHLVTGKTIITPVVELNTIAGGMFTQMEVFHFDAAGLLATMK